MNKASLRVGFALTIRRMLSIFRRSNKGMPVTLQIVDDIHCKAGCKNCLFTAFKVRSPGLTLKEVDDLIEQADSLDITNIYLMGADPFYRDDSYDYLKALAKHKKQLIFLFSEGKRVTSQHLDIIAAAGNIIPMLNIDGMAHATDMRKGKGTHEQITQLISELSLRKIPWFVTTMVSKVNFHEVTSLDYINYLSNKGAWVLAFLPYTPVDAKKEFSIVLSPEDRDELFKRSMALNSWKRKLVVLDMLGIERELTACPAARFTMTVFHDGTVTPCPAVPIGSRTSNVREKSLREIFLNDPLYQAIRHNNAERAKKGLRPTCLYYGDQVFIKNYLSQNKQQLVVINPDSYPED